MGYVATVFKVEIDSYTHDSALTRKIEGQLLSKDDVVLANIDITSFEAGTKNVHSTRRRGVSLCTKTLHQKVPSS